MQDETKAKFRAFADRYGKDEAVLDTGLTGKDMHDIAKLLESVVEIEEIDLNNLGFMNARPLHGMDHLVRPSI
jgi:hypothetical protein